MANFTASSSAGSSSSSAAALDDSIEDACSICLEPFSTDDPATVTSCKHEYHLQCILEWSQRSKECPICWQQFVLKEPACQELLAAIESERLSKSRPIAPAAPVTFPEDFDNGPDGTYFDYDDMEARIMQHLAAARYFRRREMQRYPALDASQVVDSSSAATASLMLPTNANSPNFCHGSSDTDIPTSVIRSTDNAQPPSSDPGTNRDGPFKSRVFFRQSPPDSPRRPNPSEVFSFSESVKSKWSAASARYKESISKGTRSLKERLLSRNTSVKELSKEVQREMSAGIAGVAKMIERLDLASKRSGTPAPSSANAGGPSSALFKGKGVQESAMNRRSAEVAPDIMSAAPSNVTGTNSAQLEVAHQRGL
ncbi:E3 ubiquitin-protein ligase RHF1A [Citrus sinensis]|uniref:E3 ubiquitin-protein ligase RHF1A n=1 Tax=Citrus sinensis TaxID=2711 RepID=A0ACB8I725_CITSI|nr:E3 ubiquitin-protein ligase RHF1A [Citrus sinensis]